MSGMEKSFSCNMRTRTARIKINEVIAMKEGVTVRHIMADGSICTDLSTYMKGKRFPPLTERLLRDFMLDGFRILEEREKQKESTQ